MKKFMKRSAIVAFILICVGLVISVTAGCIVGIDSIDKVVNSTTNGKMRVSLNPRSSFWGISFHTGKTVEEDSSFGDNEKINLGSEVTSLIIRCGGCEITQKISPDQNFYVESNDSKRLTADVKDGVLNLKYGVDGISIGDFDAVITIYIPKEADFENIDVNLGAGEMTFGEISAKQFLVDLGAGEIDIASLTADECNLSVGAGEVNITNMAVGTLNANVGMGEFAARGAALKTVNLDCSMGEIDLNLEGRETDFDYEVEAAMGEVTIGDRSYSGLGQKQKIMNDADKTMKVKCGMGEVKILF